VNVIEFAERIARDLHDGPLQNVFATRLRLDTLVSRVPPDIQAEILQLSEALGTTVSDATLANDILHAVRAPKATAGRAPSVKPRVAAPSSTGTFLVSST